MPFVITFALFMIVSPFAWVYQDWIIPKRRRIGYEEMRRSIRLLKETEFDVRDSDDCE